jgi:hypothetical protein
MTPDGEDVGSGGGRLRRLWQVSELVVDSINRFVRATVSSGRDEFRSIVPRIFSSDSARGVMDDTAMHWVGGASSSSPRSSEAENRNLVSRFWYRMFQGWGRFKRDGVTVPPGQRSLALTCAARLLPGQERDDWLEENRAYLSDIDGRLRRRWWVVRQVLAMPRYAYTVRTDAKKESA